MVLLLLTTGEMAEVPYAVGIVSKRGQLLCVDPNEQPLAAVNREEVLAYTLNPEVARDMMDGREVRTIEAGTGLSQYASIAS